MYFVYQGKIDMYYKDNIDPLLKFESGSYFGDISYIFNAKNQFYFMFQPPGQEHGHDHHHISPERMFDYFRMYTLQDAQLQALFRKFPNFKSMLQIRAIRRQRYFKKLKRQQCVLY